MNRLIELSGSAPIQGCWFRSARFSEALSEHSSASVYIESDSALLNPDDFLSTTLCIGFETQANENRYFDGVVTEFEQVSLGSGGRCTYRLELKTWSWLLGRNQEFKVYQNKPVHAIVAEVFARHAHPSIRFDDRTQGERRPWVYCVQFGESDLNFIKRILEQEGIYFYFEHSKDSHTMVLVDAMSAHLPYPGYESLLYDPAHGASRMPAGERIQSLVLRKSIEPPRHAHTDYNFQTPSLSLLSHSEGATQPHNKPYEVFEYPGEFDNPSAGLAYSKLRHEESLARQMTYKGQTSARGVASGFVLQIECDDTPLLNTQVLVTATQITLHEADPEAVEGMQSLFDCSFEAIHKDQTFRPPRLSRKPFVKGPLPALVVGPAGREIHTDEFGRIKIQFYWDRYGERNEHSSCWVRVAFPAAGQGWGIIAIPRIGQEVVVSFEDGDPDRPLVTAVAYNAAQHVPYPLPDHKTVSGWRTRSSEHASASNFNELRFEDKKGEEYVWFQAEKDYLSLIKHQSREEIGDDAHRLIHGKLFEEIKKDVSRTIEGMVREKIEQAFHFTANDDVLAQVKGLLSLINDGGVTLSSQGQLSVACEQSADLRSSGNLNLSTSSSGNFKAASALKLSAGTGITLASGGSSISISPAGIVFSGPTISVAGGGKAGGAEAASPANPEASEAPQPVQPPIDPIP
ncbi:type VI secretion system Vgr family protein [Limnobacter sp.]|uniref:type VI secretion system Vgr family protein n=1 Tax=Limnobacter sp. TaxID=2003368 RepID=UPI0035119B55